MLNIDEAIAQEREKAKEQRYYAHFEKNSLMYQSCIRCAEYHEQLAELLEELKCYKNDNDFSDYTDKLYKVAFNNGYNKAIDDCKELTFREVAYHDSLNDRTEFRELAEQLKVGVNKNE